MPWLALSALGALDRDGPKYTIDLRAVEALGAPVVVAHLQPAALSVLFVLSPREREVASLISRGLSNKVIARQLGISVSTVKDHVHNILSKAGASSRGQLTAMLLNSL